MTEQNPRGLHKANQESEKLQTTDEATNQGSESLTPPKEPGFSPEPQLQSETIINGEANDGKVFTAESPEVITFLEEFPEATLEVAIGSVVMKHNESLTK